MLTSWFFAAGAVLLALTWWIPFLNLLTIPTAVVFMLPALLRKLAARSAS